MTQFRSSRGNQIITLSPQAETHSGGEGRIYRLPQDHSIAAKVYHRPASHSAAKLEFMVSHPPTDPMAAKGHTSIAWPVDTLYTTGGQPQIAGFLMHWIRDMREFICICAPPLRKRTIPGFDYRYLNHTARNTAAAFHALHARGYLVGDVNETNVMVADTALVTLVDTDSFQVSDPQTGAVWRCPVGRPEFTCPEFLGVDFATVDRTVQSDLFGLSVLIFMLLMEGFHPLAGIYHLAKDLRVEECISQGYFPYDSRQSNRCTPPPLAPPYAMLHPTLQGLFIRCFVDGHKSPEARPTTGDWLRGLEIAERNLIPCHHNSRHLYGNHLQGCPWCERTKMQKGRDPFPAQQVPVQVPLRRTHVPPPVSAVRCQQCGESNAYDQLYCKKCLGFLDPVKCANPDCRADNPRRASYCGYCGSKR